RRLLRVTIELRPRCLSDRDRRADRAGAAFPGQYVQESGMSATLAQGQALAQEQGKAFVRQLLGRKDAAVISELVEPGSKVLDLGCGEGELLAWLAEHKQVTARGVEISPARVQRCIAQGLSVYQGDIDTGLADYPDACFDFVILSQTLQETRRPLSVLREMLRVGRRVIVAFPNF